MSGTRRSTLDGLAHRRTLLLAVFLLASGCTLIPPRPAQVPDFAPGEEGLTSRPVLAGCYADRGEAFTEQGRRLGEVSLSGLLFGDPASAPADGRLVAIEEGPETIDLRILGPGEPGDLRNPGEPDATHRFSRYTWLKAWTWDRRIQGEPFYPVKGFVEIDRGAEQGGAAWLGLYVVGRSCLVRKAVDGSLLVLQDVNAAGVAVVVPFAARRTIWCRFPARAGGCPLQSRPPRTART